MSRSIPWRTKLIAVAVLSGLLLVDSSVAPVAAGSPAPDPADDPVQLAPADDGGSAEEPAPAPDTEVTVTAVEPRAGGEAGALLDDVHRFRETFDLTPGSPRSFTDTSRSRRWHVIQNVNDFNRWRTGDPVDAQHGPGCEPPPATHRADRWKEYVYVCAGHLMTARAAPSYAATYLMPRARLDWSSRWARARWDVSTLSMSDRDWIDVWVTPIRDALMVPIDHNGPSYQGTPRNAVHVRSNKGGEWRLSVIRDFRTVASKTLRVPDSFPRSAKTRTPMMLTIRNGRVAFRMVGVGEVAVNVGPNFRRGLVQWGHHAYNPTKDGAGVPATWHWDNFTLTPATVLPVKRVTPQRRIGNVGERRTFTFSRPAVRRDHLLFDAVCKVSLNFGSGFQRVSKQPASGGNQTKEFASSYRVKVPPGAEKVVVRFHGDGWYDGWPCMVENPIIVRHLRNPRPVPLSWG